MVVTKDWEEVLTVCFKVIYQNLLEGQIIISVRTDFTVKCDHQKLCLRGT
jgi:hypothetical protein